MLACSVPPDLAPGRSRTEAHAPAQWMQTAAHTVREASVLPPHAARAFAYTALSMHLAVESRYPAATRTPIATQWLTGLTHAQATPAPESQAMVAQLAVCVGARVLAGLIAQQAHNLEVARDDLLHELHASSGVNVACSDESDRIADHVLARAAADGYAATRGRAYSQPTEAASWVPTGPLTQPLEPYWSTLQTFAANSAARCSASVPAPAAFATDPDSAFYQQARAVQQHGELPTRVTDAARITAPAPAPAAPLDDPDYIAYYWADAPWRTTTPAGHWLEIAAQEVTQRDLDLRTSAQILAATTTAMADAFVGAWQLKYQYNLLRPVTYIRRYIDATWTPRLVTPAFPEYVSGHAAASAAAAEILTLCFGTQPFVDIARDGVISYDTGQDPHPLFARAFASYQAAAEEAAQSRLYGGIHFPMGNAGGLQVGACAARELVPAFGLLR